VRFGGPAIDLSARRQPVATDLRIVITSLRMSADLERAGDLAQHVAKLPRLRRPERAVPDDVHRTVLDMGRLAQRLMARAAEVLITEDVDAALRLEQDDARTDELHRMVFQHLVDDRWDHGVEMAVDVGRYGDRSQTVPSRSPGALFTWSPASTRTHSAPAPRQRPDPG
jgi:phosphate transport system protein